MDTKATIRQIAKLTDEALAPFYGKIAELEGQIALYRNTRGMSERTKALYAKRVEELTAKLAEVEAEAAPLEAIAKAGGWRRFIFVPGGHVHRFACATLRRTTQRVWLPEYSGADEAELVADAGEAACTTCFPSAPVDRPSRIAAVVRDRAEVEAEAKAKADAKAAKAAAAIEVPELRKTFKSQRAAENAVGEAIDTALYFKTGDNAEHLTGEIEKHTAEAKAIAAAIAAKIDGYDADALLARKAEAKLKEFKKWGRSVEGITL